jgi:hypothetical protein
LPLKNRVERIEKTFMDDDRHEPAAPARHDVVEVTDLATGHRVTAAVEDASDERWSLLFDLASAAPQDASVHWDDGEVGWQARARLESIEDTTARFRIASAGEWEPAPVRRSLRTPVDNSPMLVRVTESSALRAGQRIHVVCLDISDSGCRLSWPGRTPRVGDTVEVTWETNTWHHEDPEWIPAQIARIDALPFGAKHVGVRFDLSTPIDAVRVHRWSRRWLDHHHRRFLSRRRA